MHLTRDDLYSLERYAEIRGDFRARVMAHKKNRQVALGAHATLYFEDRLTMQYQVQEMLRVERIFEPEGIQDELDAYNALIPDGSNWKATFMIEYEDPEERREALGQLRGIEDRIWVQVHGCDRVFAIADEDMDREDARQDLGRALPALRADPGHDCGAKGRRCPGSRERPSAAVAAASRHRRSVRAPWRRTWSEPPGVGPQRAWATFSSAQTTARSSLLVPRGAESHQSRMHGIWPPPAARVKSAPAIPNENSENPKGPRDSGSPVGRGEIIPA